MNRLQLESGIKGSVVGGRGSDPQKGKSSEWKLRTSTFRKTIIGLLFVIITFLPIAFILHPSSFAAEKWSGVDETVVNKYAREQGRKAWKPLIQTDQGDLLLFLFLLAGAVGGFIAGYYWRLLMVERSSSRNEKMNTSSKDI